VAVVVDRVPDGERHAEEPLPGDVPVADESVDPVLVADAHEVGPPLQLAPAREELLLRRVADEPLPVGDDLERLVAVLPELHRMRDRARVAFELARLPEQLDDALLRLLDRTSGELRVR